MYYVTFYSSYVVAIRKILNVEISPLKNYCEVAKESSSTIIFYPMKILK